MATLVLGNCNYSSWSMRGWLYVRQAGLAVNEVVVPLDTPETAETIKRYSPSGLVPALVEGDRVVWDSSAILEDLAERFPHRGLWPGDPNARAMARSIVAEMHSGFRDLRAEMPMNIRASKPGYRVTDAAARDVARICQIWRDCRARFGGGGSFLFGAWSGADCAYAPVVTRFVTYGVDLDETCRAYADAVMSHPDVAVWSKLAAEEPWAVAKYDAI